MYYLRILQLKILCQNYICSIKYIKVFTRELVSEILWNLIDKEIHKGLKE